MRKKMYHIQINGSDNSTEFNRHLSESEFALLEDIASESVQVSTGMDQPTMRVLPYKDWAEER